MPKRILVQAGHAPPREPGFESGTGTIGEIEQGLAVQKELLGLLNGDSRFDAFGCPGNVPDGWTGDLFLSLHCDGSGSPASRGYCFGFPPAEFGPQTDRFLACLESRYNQIPGHPFHRADNYTGDLRGYYGFHRVNCPVKTLFEQGFMTNPTERAWLESHRPQIARACYLAILDHYAYRVADDYWAWVRWRLGEGEFKGHQLDPARRPNVPKLIPPTWWVKLIAFVAARKK